MNFYHFRPSCKVIKRSRNSKGPFFTHFPDEIVMELHKCPEEHLRNGEVVLENFGIKSCYSRKVFVGGLPLDVTEQNVIQTFHKYGSLGVDWPYKDDTHSAVPPKGFAFLLFEENQAVDLLIRDSEKRHNEYYIRLSSPSTKNKNVQIRPWKLSGIDYVFSTLSELRERFTVFVGGVPRTLSAEQLGITMTALFGRVTYVGIDTDPIYYYPKGAARVAFQNFDSVVAAVKKRFLMPCETKTRKMMEIKPYILDDQQCDKCDTVNERCSTLFCPEADCLMYLCEFCWATVHNADHYRTHKPLVKQGLEDYMNSLKKRGFQ